MEKKQTEKKSTWDKLSNINVNEYTETRDGLTYLKWSWAWSLLKSEFPDASYSIREWDGKPYLFDPMLGYMVETSVTVDGETLSMWLPVMDNKNKAMKDVPYEYATKTGRKTVEAATMFDINTNLMRCLVKNISMFGLGNYIYAGEEFPEAEAEEMKKKMAQAKERALKEVKEAKNQEELKKLYFSYPELSNDMELRQAIVDRTQELNNGNKG